MLFFISEYTMKRLFYSSVLPITILVIAVTACTPSIDSSTPNSLLHRKIGSVLQLKDTNTYSYLLESGCPYPLGVESADTSAVKYDVSHLRDTISVHTIVATAKPGLKRGIYYGTLAIVTLKPTVESFRDTLRDT